MYLDDMTVGMEFTTESVTISAERMIAFAREYDPFPIHYDEAYARTTRYGKLIAPGIMSFMSVWAKVVECDLIGDELVGGKSTRVEWPKPVFAGDVLTGRVKVTGIRRRNPYNGVLEITMDIYNQKNELVMTSVVESIVKYRGA